MRSSLVSFQIGKHGLTPGFIEALEITFKNHELVKIAILKSACRDRDELKKIAEEICSELKKKLNKSFTAKIVGFTLYVRKWRKIV
ncbi:MAG: YhbY family RNA-binding protein [Candidatus Pacearchaeota archaeon]